MGVSQQALSEIEAKKKLTDLILANIASRPIDFSYDQSAQWWRSNNFIQHVLNFERIFDAANQTWNFKLGDSSGRQIVKAIITDRQAVDNVVMNNALLPSLGIITHAGLDISGVQEVGVHISTTGSTTVRFQFSDDGSSWYDLRSIDDAARSWAVNNAKYFIDGTASSHYMRVVVQNLTTNQLTVRCVIVTRN